MRRTLILWLDALLSRIYGVYVFWDDTECILRLEKARARHTLRFAGHEVQKGEPVLALHFWNGRLPPLPRGGPDLGWALDFRRRFVLSLRAVAREMQRDPSLSNMYAVGGSTGIFAPDEDSAGGRIMTGLGFTVTRGRNRLGRFGEFWENLYSWWLMWAYSRGSMSYRQFSRLHRGEMWMAPDEFLERYGTKGT